MTTVYKSKYSCCGCGVCAIKCPKSAINMISDEEGFLYPNIDNILCIDCGICQDSCPFQKNILNDKEENITEVYAIKHKNDKVRQNSSSGGAFTAISDLILKRNGIIYGALLTDDLVVVHRGVVDVINRDKMRGSKYVQSKLDSVFEDCLFIARNKPVLFVGTPCQISALKSLADDKQRENLLLCDFICHGVPSPLLFADHLKFIEKNNKKHITGYRFRSKIEGWTHVEEITFEDGTSDHKSCLSQIFKYLFHSGISIRPSCFYCPYCSFSRPGDITIGDFWGVEEALPGFVDKLGISLLLTNTEKGKEVFREISNTIDYLSSTPSACSLKQEHLFYPTRINKMRSVFWNDYKARDYGYAIRIYLFKLRLAKLKKALSNILKRLFIYNIIKFFLGK